MADLIVTGIIVIIIGAAIAYIIREKKRGVKCIGCPSGGNCSQESQRHCNGGCGHCSGKCSYQDK